MLTRRMSADIDGEEELIQLQVFNNVLCQRYMQLERDCFISKSIQSTIHEDFNCQKKNKKDEQIEELGNKQAAGPSSTNLGIKKEKADMAVILSGATNGQDFYLEINGGDYIAKNLPTENINLSFKKVKTTQEII